MQRFKTAVRRYLYSRQIDMMLLALYLYLLAGVLMAVSGIDVSGLLNEALLPDQRDFEKSGFEIPRLTMCPVSSRDLLLCIPLLFSGRMRIFAVI